MKEIIQVLQYEGDNETFVWKHPNENFNTGTQLIVHESQEAIFFMNGQALDLFGPGRYTLETQNLPLVGKYFNRATGDETPFHCEVYFINKTEQMAIKWGTDSQAEYVEPQYQFPIKIGASGEMNLKAVDVRKLLVKVVGTEKQITQSLLVQKFRGYIMAKIKTYLVRIIKNNKISIFEIDEHLSKMSEELHNLFRGDFLEYGIGLERFYVTTIVKPEEDRAYQKFKELHFRQYADIIEAELRQKVSLIEQQTQAQRMIIEAQGLAQKRATEGYTYQQERQFDVAEKVASNKGIGEYNNLGVGLGMMMGVGGSVGSVVGNMVHETLEKPMVSLKGEKQCANCKAKLHEEASFCAECGTKVEEVANQEQMICVACGKEVPKRKFCVACGSKQRLLCKCCQSELVADAKFCPECGEKQ